MTGPRIGKRGALSRRLSLAALSERLAQHQLAVLAFIALLVFWELVVVVFGVREIILPRPSRILAVMIEERALLIRNMWITLYEILVGFALSVVVGIGLAVAIVHSRFLE